MTDPCALNRDTWNFSAWPSHLRPIANAFSQLKTYPATPKWRIVANSARIKIRADKTQHLLREQGEPIFPARCS